MTGKAGAVVNRLSPVHQLINRQRLHGKLGLRCSCAALRQQPRVKILWRYCVHLNRHKAVVSTTQLCALAAVNSLFRNAGPSLIDKARNGVTLHGNLRHPPRMDHVIGGNQKTDFGVSRNHQWLVDLEQVIVTLVLGVVDLLLRRSEIREEGDGLAQLVQILVLPFPLIPRDENIELGFVIVVNL